METKKRTYIWGIPTRMFHWMLVLALIGAYIAEEYYLTAHVALGYTAGILIFFRLIWGIIGPKYSHFRDFPISIGSVSDFIKNLGKSSKIYAGHNPASSLVMIAIMLMILIVAFTGTLTLAQEGGQGLMKSLTFPAGIEFKEVHEVAVQILIALVIIHLLGILTDLFIHKSHNALKSMFTGYKTGVIAEDSNLNGFQKIFAMSWFAAPLIAFYLTLSGPAIRLKEESEENEQTEMFEDADEAEADED